MKEELIITRREDKILTLRAEDRKIRQVQAESAETEGILGNIYVGKVRNIVKNINAAFVEFQKGQMGYLSLESKVIPIHTDGVPFQEGRVLIGDEIIVQVEKEALKTKPPALTGTIDLVGKYVVLSADGSPRVNISGKIKDRNLREELKQCLEPFLRPEFHFIARTNSVEAGREELIQEAESLSRQYQEIVTYGKHKAQFTCLKKALSGYLCEIRDSYLNRMQQIITDDPVLYEEMQLFLLEMKWKEKEKLRFWDGSCGKLDAVYNISKSIDHALMPKVWLKHGGYLVIQPTEALVSIDVNTGKTISKKRDIQQTFLKVNKEAAEEIAVQLRLRNLSGIILIDFIDMTREEDNRELMEFLKQVLAADPVQTTVIDMTKLGLVEVTRKKIRKSLYEQLHH